MVPEPGMLVEGAIFGIITKVNQDDKFHNGPSVSYVCLQDPYYGECSVPVSHRILDGISEVTDPVRIKAAVYEHRSQTVQYIKDRAAELKNIRRLVESRKPKKTS